MTTAIYTLTSQLHDAAAVDAVVFADAPPHAVSDTAIKAANTVIKFFFIRNSLSPPFSCG